MEADFKATLAAAEATVQTTAMVAAVAHLLVTKGVITADELDSTVAAMREHLMKQLDEPARKLLETDEPVTAEARP